jgi:hypothetical protein
LHPFRSIEQQKNRFTLRGLLSAILSPPPQSGAEATALQTLARLLVVLEFREASGLRRVHRRFCLPRGHWGQTQGGNFMTDQAGSSLFPA